VVNNFPLRGESDAWTAVVFSPFVRIVHGHRVAGGPPALRQQAQDFRAIFGQNGVKTVMFGQVSDIFMLDT
jgi:hypothetical protein